MRRIIGECNCRLLDALAGEFDALAGEFQRSRKGKPCAVYYWGMQLEGPRRIGRRVSEVAQRKAMCGVFLGNATADC